MNNNPEFLSGMVYAAQLAREECQIQMSISKICKCLMWPQGALVAAKRSKALLDFSDTLLNKVEASIEKELGNASRAD
jgi:hypothetical protein